MRRTLRLLLIALAALGPAGAGAQTISLSGGAAAFLPLRDLGKATGDLRAPTGEPLQVRSGLTAAPLLTARLAIGSPWEGAVFHASFSGTLGARAEGEVALCGLLREQGIGGIDCETRSVDARVQLLAAGVTLARPRGSARLRPFLSLEAGAVRYAFEERACEEADAVCLLHQNVLEDRADPMVHFALGMVTEVGPAVVRGELGDVVSAYKGGGERTRGETQNHVVLRALLAIPLR